MTKLFASMRWSVADRHDHCPALYRALLGTDGKLQWRSLYSRDSNERHGYISRPQQLSPSEGVSCYPASGNGSTVSMAALSIAAHLYGNPDTWYDAGMPPAGTAVLGKCLSRWFRLLGRLAGRKPAMRAAGDRSFRTCRFALTCGR